MAISPTGGPGLLASLRPPAKKNADATSQSKQLSSVSPQEEAHQAERDARERIVQAEKRAQEAQRESSAKLDYIERQHENATLNESVKQEESLQNQRNQGYEALRELRRKQQAELNQVRREGERDLAQIKNHYNNTIIQTDREGEQNLTRLKSEQGRAVAYEVRSEQDEAEALRQNHAQRLHTLQDTQSDQVKQMTDATNQEYDRLRANANLAREQARENFNSDLKSSVEQYNEELRYVNSNANRELSSIRKDTSEKLAAYSSRQNDPFYKLVDTRADFYDAGDAFVLTASIPEHEQDRIHVSVKGDNLVLSGARRNEEKLEIAPGRTQGTASFQSFYESYPLNWPVEARQMIKTFDGDRLIVRIPKKNDHVYRPKTNVVPEKARVERPKFPGNLPTVKHASEKPLPESTELPPKSKRGGSKPLL